MDSGGGITVVIAGGGTGGHLMPALAVAGALRARHPEWRIVLVGATRGLEATLLPTRPYPYHLLPAEPIYRKTWWKNLRWPWIAIRLIGAVRRVLATEAPALVLGTGGYAAGPVVWLAARRGIPTAILEQDAYPGLTTRVLARRVREVYLGAPEAAPYLKPGPATRVVHTGSPISPPDPERRASALRRFAIPPGRPVLLLVGGSQGAVALNEWMARLIDGGHAHGATIIWATGRFSHERFTRYQRAPDIQVFDFLDPIADAYAVADLAICRAGMMTIAELCAWGIPSLLVPLPSAAADHQTSNAKAMAQAGAAVHLPQSELTADPDQTARAVRTLLSDQARLSELRSNALERGRPAALADIVARLERLLT